MALSLSDNQTVAGSCIKTAHQSEQGLPTYSAVDWHCSYRLGAECSNKARKALGRAKTGCTVQVEVKRKTPASEQVAGSCLE